MSLLLPFASPSIHRFSGTLTETDEGLVAHCWSVADAAAVLGHRRETEIPVRIDLGALRAVIVDPVRRIAWVQPGATCRELDAATQEHGLAVTGDRVSGARVVASALGPGGGWLERRMGLASDSLRAARVLTAAGHLVTASATENADLFWALRGGGEEYGIVVEVELALRPVGPAVLGGTLAWPRSRAREVIAAYRSLMAEAPDALGGGLVLDGDTVSVLVVYIGPAERGAEHLVPLRALGPARDDVAPTTYCAVQRLTAAAATEIRFLDALGDDDIDAIADADGIRLRPLGGAFGRVGEMETAHGHRHAPWAVEVLGSGASAVPPPPPPDGSAERRARLADVKHRWDPEGLL